MGFLTPLKTSHPFHLTAQPLAPRSYPLLTQKSADSGPELVPSWHAARATSLQNLIVTQPECAAHADCSQNEASGQAEDAKEAQTRAEFPARTHISPLMRRTPNNNPNVHTDPSVTGHSPPDCQRIVL